MKTKSGRTTLRLAGLLLSSSLFFISGIAQAEQRPTMTSHVPEVVASGLAPLVGHLPSTQRLSLAISLPLRNEAELDDLLQQIYDPQSPSFHKYLSVAEFTSRFGPTQSDHATVLKFAQANGLALIDLPANRMVVDVEASAAAIENAFHITLGVYQHPSESRTFYAPDREPTPDLNVTLLHISGLDDFSLPHAKSTVGSMTSKKATGSGPNGSFLGSDLRAAYYGSGPLNGAGQSVGLLELGGYAVSDVDLYFSNANQTLNVPIVNVVLNKANPDCSTPCHDYEEVLDIEQAISMAPGMSQLVVYVGKSNVSIFNQMASNNTSTSLSCSWGWKDNESSLDPIFEEMAAQGQTVFVATGDQGSNTPADVVWPADDPYITAVGGTVLTTKSAGGAWKSETGWKDSAGMPSPNGVPIPSYQQLAGVINSSNDGSTTLRNIPDVASESQSYQYVCYNGGTCVTTGGGTSYAAPLWASLIAMANQQAAANGDAPIGFLNPALYAIGVGSSYHSDFHDIISGNNGAYSAVTGYDLVTGWGSPNGVPLINALPLRLKK
jgi:subtilase family serine protease